MDPNVVYNYNLANQFKHLFIRMKASEYETFRKPLESLNSFLDAYPTIEQQETLLATFEKKFLPPEVLDSHKKLQKILFPIVAPILNMDQHVRRSEEDLRLFTWPIYFATIFPTDQLRAQAIEEIGARVTRTLVEEERDSKFLLGILRRINRGRTDDQNEHWR